FPGCLSSKRPTLLSYFQKQKPAVSCLKHSLPDGSRASFSCGSFASFLFRHQQQHRCGQSTADECNSTPQTSGIYF
ncbi:hypothetical protein STEG23_023017, partial [Scotinomys teguina]